jgi:hypothetical protein
MSSACARDFKMATGRTGRPVGRPRKKRQPPLTAEQKRTREFLKDPDRYAVALLNALVALGYGSERACALAIVVWEIGVEAAAPLPSESGLVVTNWWREKTRTGSRAASLRGRETTLRAKRRRLRSRAEILWIRVMASAFMLVLRARDRAAAEREILRRAECVGEGEFARTVMLPMLDAKSGSLPPEFPSKSVSTQKNR